MKKRIILICNDCLFRNYSVTKNFSSNKRLMLKKFCPHCNKHTIHKETR